MKDRNRLRKLAAVALLDAEIQARGGGCQDCGAAYDGKPRRFHWHHRDPATKNRSVRDMLGYSTERLLDEIAKCDFLCAGCHLGRHRDSPRAYPATKARRAA